MASTYAGFFAAYNASVRAGSPLSKEEVVGNFTNHRTTSLKELSGAELEALVAGLNQLNRFTPKVNHKPTAHTNPDGDKMRKAIIAIFYKMKRTAKDAIDWCEKQGVAGEKRKFNDYSNQELYTLIRVAEKVLSDWQMAIRKKLNDL